MQIVEEDESGTSYLICCMDGGYVDVYPAPKPDEILGSIENIEQRKIQGTTYKNSKKIVNGVSLSDATVLVGQTWKELKIEAHKVGYQK